MRTSRKKKPIKIFNHTRLPRQEVWQAPLCTSAGYAQTSAFEPAFRSCSTNLKRIDLRFPTDLGIVSIQIQYEMYGTFVGSVHDNTVANAEMGVLIDDVHDMEVYDNPVSNPAPFTTASCGQKWTHAYAIGDRSANINGRKCFITNGSLADFIVVYAYTGRAEKCSDRATRFWPPGAENMQAW